MTAEQRLLAEMNAGLVTVCPVTLAVSRYVPSRKRWEVWTPDVDERTGRVRFKFGHPCRCTVQRARLVFIWVHRRIPTGVVDHKDLDRTNDRPGNLRECSRAESDRQGYERQLDKRLASLLHYFEFVGEFGVEPEYL